MTQRVQAGLGLPAGLYCLGTNDTGPTFYAPNGITADGVPSIILANVVQVVNGYDSVAYNGATHVFFKYGSPNPSPYNFNGEAMAFAEDVIRQIFNTAQPEGEFPYSFETSSSRANIVGDLDTLVADFTLNPST